VVALNAVEFGAFGVGDGLAQAFGDLPLKQLPIDAATPPPRR